MVDLGAPAVVQDPYPTYAHLRDEEPVCFWELDGHPRGGMWLVSRHADVRALVADDRFTKQAPRVGLDAEAPPILMFLDPPEHTRLRHVATAAFTRRRVERLREAITADVAALATRLRGGQAVDLVEEFARPLPLHTIMSLLGLPIEQAERLHVLTERITDGSDAAGGGPDLDAEGELLELMAQHVARVAQAPGDDLASALVADGSGDGDARLTEQDVALLCLQLLVNGHETTVNLIGTGLWALLSHRDQWERLVADPSLAPRAVEECLRFDAPNQRSSARYALEDLDVAGTRVGAGEQVAGLLGAANRDERAFERPDGFDIARDPNPHLSFGRGRHHCPGAALTRLEVAVAFAHLAVAVPALEVVERPAYRDNSFDRGLASLVVRVDR